MVGSALAHRAGDGSIAVMAISGHATPLVPTGDRHITSNATENSRAVPGMRLRPPRDAGAVPRVRYNPRAVRGMRRILRRVAGIAHRVLRWRSGTSQNGPRTSPAARLRYAD